MKTYSQFKTELQQLEIVESTTYFVEELLEEDLFEIIINESYDDSDKILSTLELYSRELIDLSEEELESLIDYYSELNEGWGQAALDLGAKGLSKTVSLAKKYGPGVMQKGKEVLGKAAENAKGAFNKAKTGFTSGLQGNKAPAVRGAQGKMTADTSLVTQGANKLGNLLNKAKGSVKPAAAAGVVAGAGYLAGKGSSTNSTVSAKTSPVSVKTSPASVPKTSPAKVSPVQKKSVPQTNNTLGMSSAAYNDLKSSASKMTSATSDMASKTGAMKSSMQKFAAKPAAAVSGGAPTTAVGSKPPPLDRSTAKKF